jgi:hypothetical protein
MLTGQNHSGAVWQMSQRRGDQGSIPSSSERSRSAGVDEKGHPAMATAIPVQEQHAVTSSADIWRGAGIEPRLDEMLDDPVVQLVLRRDGLTAADVRRVVDGTRFRIMARRACARLPASA